MDEGRYGVCTTCGDTIGLERLEILPATRLCLPCQRGDA
jgi:RNA polymerase-binding transcription factor DksA